jgi:hypothetical protein
MRADGRDRVHQPGHRRAQHQLRRRASAVHAELRHGECRHHPARQRARAERAGGKRCRADRAAQHAGLQVPAADARRYRQRASRRDRHECVRQPAARAQQGQPGLADSTYNNYVGSCSRSSARQMRQPAASRANAAAAALPASIPGSAMPPRGSTTPSARYQTRPGSATPMPTRTLAAYNASAAISGTWRSRPGKPRRRSPMSG